MNIRELPAKVFLAHLRRHPVREIMDEECDAALSAVLGEYGDTITHGAGLEVRLGEEARYVDFIMSIDEGDIPHVQALWYEIDYSEFKKAHETGTKIMPCLFANTDFGRNSKEKWDEFLPVFLGEERAKRLRPAFDRVLERLPEGAYPKQVGTMTSRGEIHIMRLVIMFPDWDSVPEGLVSIGWKGDPACLRVALEPWRQTDRIAVNIDLAESGVLPKIGVEVFSRWRHPLIVGKAIARLEAAGLCLPSKGEALRRWIRFRPDGDPFIQTLISYFKLNYKDGKVTEAKAYLEQSPYVHHHYFDACERPVYADFVVKDGTGAKAVGLAPGLPQTQPCAAEGEVNALPLHEAVKWIHECEAERVREVRFTGEVLGYEHLERLLAECKRRSGSGADGLRAVVGLDRKVPSAWLEKMISAGADGFLIDINGEGSDGSSVWMLKSLRDMGFKNVRARWLMHGRNAEKLSKVIRLAEKLGAAELIITGMKPPGNREFPSRAQLMVAAETVKKWQEENHKEDADAKKSAGLSVPKEPMELTVESCFSPLRALMGGEDPKKNGNRGIERGCTAGRDHFCVLPSGNVAPCRCMDAAEAYSSLAGYWENSPRLSELRKQEKPDGENCGQCAYARRCLPCPVIVHTN